MTGATDGLPTRVVLDLNGDGVLELVEYLAACLLRGEDADRKFPVRIVGVATPVTAQDGRPDTRDLVEFGQPAALDEISDQAVALGVDIRADVVGDLAGSVAEPDAPVESHGPDPQGDPTPAELLGIPEPDVVATAGGSADRLLEGEVLLPPEDEQVADRRIGVGAIRRTLLAMRRLDSAVRIGGVPAAGRSWPGPASVFGRDQADVERVAGNALGGASGLGGVFKGGVVLVVPPQSRENHVSREKPEHGHGEPGLVNVQVTNRRRLRTGPVAGSRDAVAGSCGPGKGFEVRAAPSHSLTVIVWHTILPSGSRSEVSPSRHLIIVDAGITHAVSG